MSSRRGCENGCLGEAAWRSPWTVGSWADAASDRVELCNRYPGSISVVRPLASNLGMEDQLLGTMGYSVGRAKKLIQHESSTVARGRKKLNRRIDANVSVARTSGELPTAQLSAVRN